MFRNESISNIVGSALIFKSLNNGGLTSIVDCTFYNMFGTDGGSIGLDSGGILLAQNNRFSNDIGFLKRSEKMNEVLRSKD